WRQIQVSSDYNFWDLHIAIQDSMGWYDCHLHSFNLYKDDKARRVEIGIPGDMAEGVIAGWKIPIANYFVNEGEKVEYHYDFGDDWYHEIVFEGIKPKSKSAKYPKCIGGERACPPEDCGGVTGYYDLLEVLKKRKGKKYSEMIRWLKNHVVSYYPYDSNYFDCKKVKFDNPDSRWVLSFRENISFGE
ncbi:MAG: plasmid pRiA4b ORF-3 family protein, partial [Ignavibacteria bacterium]